MTSHNLLHIQPSELKFVVKLKKQILCLLQLGNNVDQYIAFKVNSTSPDKYCVRPSMGIIKPKGKCDLTVTMQAQRMAPPDMHCKDKLVIQSTIVSFRNKEDDIGCFKMSAKDSGNYTEERKLKVVLISLPSSSDGVRNIPPSHSVSSSSDHEDLKLWLFKMDSKLREAEVNIMKLNEAYKRLLDNIVIVSLVLVLFVSLIPIVCIVVGDNIHPVA